MQGCIIVGVVNNVGARRSSYLLGLLKTKGGHMQAPRISTDSVTPDVAAVLLFPDEDPGYVHPEILRFALDFALEHVSCRVAAPEAVRVIHVSAARISQICDYCNRVGARSLDDRKGVK